ncbi:MAG: DNA-3-methyladenine glycosylase [Thermoanaerobaculia bacterium]
MTLKTLPPTFYCRDTVAVAKDLLGCLLVRRFPDGRERSVVIVETEAYLGIEDRAAHTWNGRRTARVAPMWGPGGHAYVYFVYGMHHCLNVVTKEEGEPEAVLIRAGVPEETWRHFCLYAAAAEAAADRSKSVARRGGVKGALRAPQSGRGPLTPPHRALSLVGRDELLIASGPARLCRYLKITTALSGASLSGPDLFLFPPKKDFDAFLFPILVGPRVGVAYAGEAARWPVRFAVAGCPAVTRPRALRPL